MTLWWESLSTLETFLYYIAIPATIVLIIQFVISLLGLGGDADIDADGADFDADVDFDGDIDGDVDFDGDDFDVADVDFRFVSFRTVIAFLTVFPWTGIVLLQTSMNVFLALFIAVISGLGAMLLIGYLFYATSKLQSSGNITYKNAIGAVAEVYLPIGANGSSQGKVQVLIQDRLVEANAITKGKKTFKTGDRVKIVGVIGVSTLVVKADD